MSTNKPTPRKPLDVVNRPAGMSRKIWDRLRRLLGYDPHPPGLTRDPKPLTDRRDSEMSLRRLIDEHDRAAHATASSVGDGSSTGKTCSDVTPRNPRALSARTTRTTNR